MFLWAAELRALDAAQQVAVDTLLGRLRPSVAILGDGNAPTGAAALVDIGQRLFVAHRDAVRGDTVQARLGDGSVRFSLRVLARDSRTGLVLLTSRSEGPTLMGAALTVAEAEPPVGTKVLVLVPEGGFIGAFVGGNRMSIVGDQKQAVPVSEIQFESAPQLVAGALVLSFEGRILGSMNATVARSSDIVAAPLKSIADVQKLVRKGANGGLAPGFAPPVAFSPGPIKVAYTPVLAMVRRTVAGFLSESHRVEYAALGIQVADNLGRGGGAVVRGVVDKTPASRVGIRPGDVLLAMGSRTIANQSDFIQALLAFDPGEEIPLRIRRDGVETIVKVVLARSRA